MIDEILSGFLSGIFGPVLTAWLGRFKYPIIFLIGFFTLPIVEVFALIQRQIEKGDVQFIATLLEDIFSFGFILLDVIFGFVFVFVAYINAPMKK